MKPRETLEVAGRTINFLLDTEVAYFVLNYFSSVLSTEAYKIVEVKE